MTGDLTYVDMLLRVGGTEVVILIMGAIAIKHGYPGEMNDRWNLGVGFPLSVIIFYPLLFYALIEYQTIECNLLKIILIPVWLWVMWVTLSGGKHAGCRGGTI